MLKNESTANKILSRWYCVVLKVMTESMNSMSSWIKSLSQQESRPGHLLVIRKNAVLIHYCFGFIFHTQKSHSSFIYRPVLMPTTSHSLKSSTLCEIMLPLLKGLLLKWYCRNTPASFGTLLAFSPETRTSNQHLLWFILLSNGCIKIIHHLLKKMCLFSFKCIQAYAMSITNHFPKCSTFLHYFLFLFVIILYYNKEKLNITFQKGLFKNEHKVSTGSCHPFS